MGQTKLAEAVRQRLEQEFAECEISVEPEGDEHLAVRVESEGEAWQRKLLVPFYEQAGAIDGVVRVLRVWVGRIRD